MNRTDTTTSLSSSDELSVYGQTVTFTAIVAAASPGAGTPTGDVIFRSGTETLGTVMLSGGKATIDIGSLNTGSYTITATYSGDGSFKDSSGTVHQAVDKANTTTRIVSSNDVSTFGEKVTFTATVQPEADGNGDVPERLDQTWRNRADGRIGND
ncbi:Ig-like domain-containing protein [Paenibacillus sp. 32O-W]|uniref:Ig-like domain-containing protein n=1 Tax=Paenibacillus sp. 32O-W TaxID=1695218 RepID=UPI00078247E9|nr:Ig-like domain-containing protein [Paenibacillus sp. 32O-W]